MGWNGYIVNKIGLWATWTKERTVSVPPRSRLATGMLKSRCVRGKCAMSRQQIGIEIAPTMNPPEAMTITGVIAGNRTAVK